MEDDKDERIISLASHGEKKKRTSGNRWEVGTTAKAPRGRKALILRRVHFSNGFNLASMTVPRGFIRGFCGRIENAAFRSQREYKGMREKELSKLDRFHPWTCVYISKNCESY